MLFALYIAEMGQDLVESGLGVRLYKVVISAVFFAVRKQDWDGIE